MVSTVIFKITRSLFESEQVGKIKVKMEEIEQKIVSLRKEGLTYREIQIKLGNPAKKFIRQTLLRYAPELVGDVVENFRRLKKI